MRLTESVRCVVVLCLACVGCYTVEKSEIMFELAEVVGEKFTPAHTNTRVVPSFDSEGHIELKFETEHIPDKYEMTFACQHGKFTINNDKAEGLYNRFNVGDRVSISYREKYRVYNRGKEQETKEPHGFDFIDASHLANQAEGE